MADFSGALVWFGGVLVLFFFVWLFLVVICKKKEFLLCRIYVRALVYWGGSENRLRETFWTPHPININFLTPEWEGMKHIETYP